MNLCGIFGVYNLAHNLQTFIWNLIFYLHFNLDSLNLITEKLQGVLVNRKSQIFPQQSQQIKAGKYHGNRSKSEYCESVELKTIQ